MSVSETLALPAQPTDGIAEYTPLGGDGFNAPDSATHVTVNLAGDASGGSSLILVGFDPRYTCLVSYAAVKLQGLAADANLRQEIRCTFFESFLVSSVCSYLPITGVTGALNNALWTPPAILVSAGDSPTTNGPYYRAVTANAGVGTTMTVTLRIYNFNKRARELVPLPQLLSTLVRSSTLI